MLRLKLLLHSGINVKAFKQEFGPIDRSISLIKEVD